MQLQITKSIKKRVITLELDTINFTSDENTMLDELGEPVIIYEKAYHSTAIQMSRKIRSGFKQKIKFDGNVDGIDTVSEDCDTFIEDITTILEDAMTQLNDEYSSDLGASVSVVDIKY